MGSGAYLIRVDYLRPPVTESIYRRYAIVDEAMQREAAAPLDAWMTGPPAAPLTASITALRRASRPQGRVTG